MNRLVNLIPCIVAFVLYTNMAVVGFRFPDVQESYAIHVRRGVAELQPVFPEQPDVAITTDSGVWREVVLGLRNPALALASGAIEIDGGALDLVAFLSWFSE